MSLEDRILTRGQAVYKSVTRKDYQSGAEVTQAQFDNIVNRVTSRVQGANKNQVRGILRPYVTVTQQPLLDIGEPVNAINWLKDNAMWVGGGVAAAGILYYWMNK